MAYTKGTLEHGGDVLLPKTTLDQLYNSDGSTAIVAGGTTNIIGQDFLPVSGEEMGIVKVNTGWNTYGVRLTISSGTVSVAGKAASASNFGFVRVDTTASNGVSLAVSDGTISASAQYASTDAFGVVMVPVGSTNGVALNISDGVLRASGVLAQSNAFGVVKAGNYVSINDGVLSVNLADTDAGGGTAGAVYVDLTNGGRGITLSLTSGKLDVFVSAASKNGFGTVKIGDNIDVTYDDGVHEDGIISVPLAGTSTAGVVTLASSIGTSTTNVVTEVLVKNAVDNLQEQITNITGTTVADLQNQITSVTNAATSLQNQVTAITGTTVTDLQNQINGKQNTLSVGSGIVISGDTISTNGVVKVMTTDERAVITPEVGQVVYDSDLDVLLVGDGSTQGGVPIVSHSMDNTFVYGLDYDLNTTSTSGTKVVLNHAYDYTGANSALRYHAVSSFAQTPAHAFQGVLRDLENGVNKCYLDISDSTHRADGTPLTADEKLGKWTENGVTTLVDFMVRIPITYWRKDTYIDGSGHNHVVWLVSNEQFVDSAPHPWFYTGDGGATAQVQYVGMFRGVLCDSTGNPKTQSAESTPASYANNDRLRSIIGVRPAGATTRANFRKAAASEHGNLTNMLYREWLTLMVAIDGGDLNSQNAISFGFANCSTFDYAAVRTTGRSATFGLQNGEVEADETPDTGLDLDLLTMKGGGTIWNNTGSRVVAFSWRGIENPWGSQWEFCDGCQKYQVNDADTITCSDDSVYTRYWAGNNGTTAYAWRNANEDVLYSASATPAANAKLYTDNTKETESALTVKAYTENYDASGYWTTNDISIYTSCDSDMGAGHKGEKFPSRGYTGNSYAWVNHPWPKASGNIKTFDTDSFLILTTGGAISTYFGDNFYNDASAGARVVYVGGRATLGASAGVGYFCVHYGLSFSAGDIGARLAASGENE